MSIAVKTDTGWQVLGGGAPGELPGLGGWATITSVWDGSGVKPNRYSYKDGIDWVAFEWGVGTNTVTTSGGLLDVLIVSGGVDFVAGPNLLGKGGGVIETVTYVPSGPTDFSVSDRDTGQTISFFDRVVTQSAFDWGNGAGTPNTGPEGFVSKIRENIPVEYGAGGGRNLRNPGCGGWAGTTPGVAGTCIVRVPAAQAAGVPASEYVDVP